MKENKDIFIIEDNEIKVGFTKRSIDAKNKNDIEKVCKEYNFNKKNLVFNTQVHDNKVRVIKNLDDIKNNGKEADGLVTTLKNVPLLIFTADCVPLVFYDKNNKVVGLAHAGWRGTFDNIADEVVNIMVKEYGCNNKDIKVIVGPSISVENYEVSKELIEKFSKLNIKNYYKKLADKYYLDLWTINKGLLVRSGILEENITFSNLCTVKNNEKFFSYRKDDATSKRIGTLIQIG